MSSALQETHENIGGNPNRSDENDQSSRKHDLWWENEITGFVLPNKKKTEMGIVTVFKYVKGFCKDERNNLFSLTTVDWTTNSGLKLKQEIKDIGKD